MLDSYQDIFNERGEAYHSAMKRFPEARRNEFGTLVGQLQPRPNEVICDMPSGGGYLCNYLPDDVRLELVETSKAFFERCPSVSDRVRRHLCRLDQTPFPNGSIDAVVSLAGLHHVEDLPVIFREVARILKPGGRFCLADVQDGSPVAGFLNGFIDVRSEDGNYRKYRYMVAGDRGAPRHLIVSAGWVVRADARRLDPPFIEEEIAYTRAKDSNHTALVAAARALDLDVVAFDYSYDRQHNLVLWEPNPFPLWWADLNRQSRLDYQNDSIDILYGTLLTYYLERAALANPGHSPS